MNECDKVDIDAILYDRKGKLGVTCARDEYIKLKHLINRQIAEIDHHSLNQGDVIDVLSEGMTERYIILEYGRNPSFHRVLDETQNRVRVVNTEHLCNEHRVWVVGTVKYDAL